MKTLSQQAAAQGMKLTFGDVPNYSPTMNVLDIQIPPQLEETVDTGLPFVNDLFGGAGITPSSVTLLTGTPGAGKSTFVHQLADSLTGTGHIALYNSGEESLFQVRRQAKRLGLKNGFIPSSHRLVPHMLAHLDVLRERNPGKKIVFLLDSIQTADDGYYKDGYTNGATAVRATEMITEYCKQHFIMAVLIGQVTKDGKLAGKQAMLHTVDGHAHLFIDEDKKSDTHGLRIIRMNKHRFGPSGISHILEMTERGLAERGEYGGSADLGSAVEDSE